MEDQTSKDRRLAAIMFTDIVGYTTLMGEDEDLAFQLLKKNRQLQRPIIEKHGGTWLKEIKVPWYPILKLTKLTK